MSKLKKTIGTFGVFCIASGAMIGSGIFILSGLAFAKAGSALLLSYLLACSQEMCVHHLKKTASIAALSEQHSFEKRWLEAENIMRLRNYLILNGRKRYF
jgi:L-asparagine transporter-like permease